MVETAAKLIPAIWITDPAVAVRLLGVDHRPLLDEVIDRIRQAAIENQWPLTKIDIGYRQDMEFEEWEYLLLTLRFDCPQPEAGQYWEACLDTVVDPLEQELGPLAQNLFTDKIDYTCARAMVETAKQIPAVWITKPAVADRLLGVDLRPLLDDVVDRIRQAALQQGWPLTKIEIDYHQDMEFEWWEYLLLTLRFDCPREEAQEHWGVCMRTVVKSMQQELGPLARNLFIDKIHYTRASKR